MPDHPTLFPTDPTPYEGDYAAVEPYEAIWQVEGRIYFDLRRANRFARRLDKTRELGQEVET